MPASLSFTMVVLVATAYANAGAGLAFLAPLLPLGTLFGDLSQPSVPWTTPLVCACLTGRLAAVTTGRSGGSPDLAPWAAPVGLLVLLALAAGIVDLWATQAIGFLQQPFVRGLVDALQRSLFSVSRDYVAVEATLQFVVGLFLVPVAAAAARQSLDRGGRGTSGLAVAVPALAVFGIALVALLTWTRWLTVAHRHEAPLAMAVTMLREFRITPAFPDFNAAGTLLGLGLVTGTSMAWHAGRRALAVLLAVLLGPALWLTGSRSALFFLVVVVAVAWWWSARPAKRRPGWRLPAAALLILALLVGTMWRPRADVQGTPTAAVSLRLELAAMALRMAASEPLFGVGLGRFYERSAEFASPPLRVVYPRENAHNNYLQWLGELGLIGFAAMVWLLGVWAILAVRALRSEHRPLALAPLLAGVAFVLATSVVGHPLLIPEVAYPFWLLFGFSAGLAAARPGATRARRARPAAAVAASIALIAIPVRVSRSVQARALEHQGGGWTQWRDGPDGIRYRKMSRRAWVFVDATTRGAVVPLRAPQGAAVVRVHLDGQTFADIRVDDDSWRMLRLTLPVSSGARRLRRLDLEVIDGTGDRGTPVWVGRVAATGPDR